MVNTVELLDNELTLCSDQNFPENLWRKGDIVTRDGTDEHQIINIGGGLIEVICIKEPALFAGDSEPWTKLGEKEIHLTRYYSFLRHC